MTDAFLAAATSSATCQWDTPPKLVAAMAPVFPWSLDVCASGPNVCKNHYFLPEMDGLKMPWFGLCWMNPPYGTQILEWVKTAWFYGSQIKAGITVVSLLPARTDTVWWHATVPSASQVVFIRGRLTFGSDAYWAWRWEQPTVNGKPNSLYGQYGKKQSAPFPSAFVVWGDGLNQAQEEFLNGYGWNPGFVDSDD